jgi:hypothetical protein
VQCAVAGTVFDYSLCTCFCGNSFRSTIFHTCFFHRSWMIKRVKVKTPRRIGRVTRYVCAVCWCWYCFRLFIIPGFLWKFVSLNNIPHSFFYRSWMIKRVMAKTAQRTKQVTRYVFAVADFNSFFHLYLFLVEIRFAQRLSTCLALLHSG